MTSDDAGTRSSRDPAGGDGAGGAAPSPATPAETTRERVERALSGSAHRPHGREAARAEKASDLEAFVAQQGSPVDRDTVRARVERRLRTPRPAPPSPSPAAAATPPAAPFPTASPSTPAAEAEGAPAPADPSAWDAPPAEEPEDARRAPKRPPSSSRSLELSAESPSRLAAFVATCCYLGRLPLAPGTWGAAAGFGAWTVTSGFPPTGQWVLVAAATGFGIWAAGRHAEDLGAKDPREVVVDEFCGMWLALVAAANSFVSAAALFVLFRILDIAKPPPIRWLERIPGGFGIMLDDLVAAAIAAGAIGLVTHVFGPF